MGDFGFTTSSVMATHATLMAFLRLVRLFLGRFGNGGGHLLSMFLSLLSLQFIACFSGF